MPRMLTAVAIAMTLVWPRCCDAREDFVSARYIGPTDGYTRKIAIQIEQSSIYSGIVDVGPIDYQFFGPADGTGRSLVGAVMPTFGVEVETPLQSERRYTLTEIAFGPEPVVTNLASPGHYGQRRQSLVHAVVGAAIQLGWLRLDGTIQDSLNDNLNRDRMAAVQLLVWESVFETREAPERWSLSDGSFTASMGQTPGVKMELVTLAEHATTMLEGNLRVEGLRTMTTRDSQDRLVIVRTPERTRRLVRRVDGAAEYFDSSDTSSLDPNAAIQGPTPGSPNSGGFTVFSPPPFPPTSNVVPLPPAVWPGIAAIILVALYQSRKRAA